MSWVENTDHVLKQNTLYPVEKGYILSVRWQRDIPANELSQIKILLDNAYSGRSMWPYFARNRDNVPHRLIFNLFDEKGTLVATRSIGEVLPEDSYWEGPCIAFTEQSSPIGGGSFTVKRTHRGQGLGELLWQSSTDWMKEHAKIEAIFGDSVSRKALQMYQKKGALFYLPEIEELCAHYQVSSLQEFFDTQPDLEEIPSELGVSYIWCLNPAKEEGFKGYHYEKITV